MKVRFLFKSICDSIIGSNLYHIVLIFNILALPVIGLNAQCSTTIYDSGGSGGNYGNYEDVTTVLDATSGKLMHISFNSFDIESNYDYFYIYDGPNTSSPLVGTYTGTSSPPDVTSTGQYLTIRFTSDNIVTRPGYSISLSCIDPPPVPECLVVTEDGNGTLFSWTASPAGNTLIGSEGSVNATEIESMCLSFDGQTVYAADAGTFGTLNHVTGAFTGIATIGDADGALGTITMDDIDGMAINPTNGYIMAVHRRGSDNDLFFVINPTTGTVEKNYFGNGVDYREIVGALQDMDDIAFHPTTNELFGISTVSNNATFDQLVLIDQYLGTVSTISNLPTCDIEGLTFNDAGVLYGSTGYEECPGHLANTIYEIDYSNITGTVTAVTTLSVPDSEALICFVSAVEPCDDVSTGGSIGSYQAICAGDDVAAFTNVTSATQSGGGGIEYQWYYSTTSCIAPLNNDPEWIAISGATGTTYDHGALYERTCFVRAAKTQGCPVYIKYSNVITVDVSPCACPSPTIETYSITVGDDDVEEHENDTMYLNSSDLEFVYDTYQNAGNQKIGLRFNNVNVPSYASVQSAKLIFKADETHSDPTTLTIEGELAGNSQPFNNTVGNLSSRNRTTSSSVWSDIEPWTTGNMYSSVYITDIISEIIQQGTWSSGNSMSLIITGSGKRVAEAFEKSSSTPAQLIIEFCSEEICDNGIDDDGDGYVDSFDPDCPSYAPFDCNKTLYQSISPDNGSNYYLYDVETDPVAFNQVYNLSANGMNASGFNSLAFNPVDRFLYGINPLKTGNYEMYMINDLNAIQYLGNVTGLSGTNDAGCMAADGTYYVTGASGKLFEINTTTLVATEIKNLGFEGGDMAINPANGLIYIWNTNARQLYTIDPGTGAASPIGNTDQYDEFGALYFNEQGEIIAYGDDSNISATDQETLVKIDPATGVVTPIGIGPNTEENDGCSCAFGVALTKEASSISVEPGDPLSYTFTIYNRTGSAQQNVTFQDILPSGLTFSSNPYNVTGITLNSPSIIGSGTANFVIANIPPGASNSFVVDINIPIDFCDDISNQASLLNLASELGTNVVSDDPTTVGINDPTYTIVGNCEEYWLESECEEVGANWNLVSDATASRDYYATINSGFNSLSAAPTGVDDRIRFNVNITNAGDYNIFARVFCPNSNDDSFWVRANGGTWYKWNSLATFASAGWEWGQVYNSDAGNAIVTFPLVAGANTIDFAYREDGARLDKIKVALSDELPTGEGGISQNCPEICGNGEDDDGDGLTDCEDGDCSTETFCQGPCVPGKLFVERWFGISGSNVTDLTSHANYPNSPDELDYITLFQGPNGYADNYGTRVRGFIIPSETGTYSFNVTGDDNTILYLSTDVDETNISEIASVTGWSGVTEHTKYAAQTSIDIELVANVWYYVELLVKEGAGGDHFQVYWKTPSVPSTWNIIPGTNLAPFICPEICDNGEDDDGDGLEDCLDPDCENGVNVYITSADNVICVGESATLQADYLGNPGLLTYAWSGGAGNSPTVIVSPTVTTTYVVTVTNTSGCEATDQIQVTVNPLPSAGASNDGDITCSDPTVLLTATPAGLTYAWSGGGTNQTKNVTIAGTYTVTVTDGNGCTATASTTVLDDSTPPNADAGTDQSICIGESTLLIATGGGTYEWEDNTTLDRITVSPTVTTDYSVTVTAPNGCTDVDVVRVIVNSLPNASISKDGDIQCDNPSVQLTASPAGLNYVWSTAETSQIINVASSGTYSVTVTDGNGCTNTAQIVVDEYLTPTTIFCEQYRVRESGGGWGSWIPFNGVCEIEICEEDGLSDIEIDGGPNLNTGWVWRDEDNNIEVETSEIVVFNDIDVTDAGNYTAVYTNEYGCISNLSINVIVNQNPVSSASNDGPITCTSPSVTLTALPAGMIYAWQGGGTAQTKTVTSSGTYAVTVTDTNGCSSVSSTVVGEDTTSPSADAGVDQDICIGESATITASGGVSYAWSHSAGNTATVIVSPTVTTTYTVTVTGANGCTEEDNIVVTVNSLPNASASNDGPITCTLPIVTMTASPTGMTYAWQGGGTDQTKIVSSPGTYTVLVTDANGCTDVATTTVTEDTTPPVANAGSDNSICEGGSIDLTATGGISYEWSHSAGNTATVSVNPSASTTYTVTVTAANGCQDTDDITITVDTTPIVSVTGMDTICIQTTTTLSPSTGGTWQSSDNNIAIVSGSGVVYGLNPGVATFVFTSSTTGCQSETTAEILVTPDLSVDIGYSGGICLQDDTQLSANVTGGTMNFTYSWTGPNGFTATTQVIDVIESGSYYVTATDVAGCSDNTSAYIFAEYDPFIFTLDTEICEDESTVLSVNSASAVGYQWSANAGSATTQNVTVYPGLPSEDYYVTVTNDIGCTTEATVHIDVKAKTSVSVSGTDEICIGESTTLSPTSGGIWTSSDNSIAGVTNAGVVTGLAAGTVTFTFLDSITNCLSDPTTNVTILSRPVVSVSGPDVLCEGENTTLSPSTGGTWISNNPALATVTNDGIVTAISSGSVSFVFTDTTTGCVSNATTDITIYPTYTTTFTGPTDVCLDDITYLSPTSGGTWQSNDTNVATVSNIGVVTTVGVGTVTFTFTSDFSCVSGATAPLTVRPKDVITISGDSELCEDEIITLTASAPGGTWSSSNSTIASVNSSGQVTGIAFGSATITYTHDPSTCAIDPTFDVTVIDKPTVFVSGTVEICVGETTSVSASIPWGTWSSSDESVAIVSVDGTVVGVSEGTATFTYTAPNGCVSDASNSIIVNPEVDVNINYIGSPCLDVDTKLVAAASGGTANYTYSWSGPGGFTSNQDTIDVPLSGLYNVLVTDAEGCSSNTTAYVYEEYNPFVFTLDTEVCEGENITLSVNGSSGGTFQWSANAGSATTQSVTVTPPVPGDTYYVTITSSQGCSTVANAVITVEQIPTANLTGLDSICVGETTTLSPTSGGLWSSSNYSVASVTNSGIVNGLGAGGATFTFRDTSTGCYSAPTTNVAIAGNENITISGDDDICVGFPEILTASIAGGSWSSSNPGVATISPTGEVTPLSAGTTDIIYTPVANTCYNIAVKNISVNNLPSVNVNGPSTICEGELTYLVPTNGGVWESSDTTIAKVSNIGVITGISGGSATFTFTSNAGCVQTLPTAITVIDNPVISLTGPSSICLNTTTTLSPTTGGIWLSSNNLVASVTSSGLVLGKLPGVAEFSFIELANGCVSNNTISVTVNGPPTINGLDDNKICAGSTTSITPSIGGVWSTSDPAVATITSGGIITGVSSGAATFTFTNSSTGCDSEASAPLTVDGNPVITITGETELCVGENSSIIPGTGGTWSSSDVSIATITNAGIITAVSSGDVTFTFTSDNTGCNSLASDVFTVNNPTNASISGPTNLCNGTVETLVSSNSGTWESSNPAIASVNNAGVVTANAPGIVTITLYTTASCITNPTIDIQIDPEPNPIFTGSNTVCLGFSTTLSPTSGGDWTSSNDAIATIDNAGNVTTISSGIVDFTFTDSLSGCVSTTASSLNIFDKPTISIAGNNAICIGENTSMLPSSGGLWTSSDISVATIEPNGLVTGISEGTVTFTYLESGTTCLSNASSPITVLPKPSVSIIGDTELCIGSTSTLSPSTGGGWLSSDVQVATVTDQGIVTAVGPGIARFTFVSNEGCSSNQTSPIVVFGAPSITIDGSSEVCVGDVAQMLPSAGGSWTSSDETVATIGNDGVVTSIAPGSVTFQFTNNSTGCVSQNSDLVTVNPIPETNINGPANICIGTTTNFTPSSGGVWSSVDPSIASIENNGVVTGLSTGTTKFLFTQLSTGCVSDSTIAITVTSESTPVFAGPDVICIGDTSYITPSTGGTWESTNINVATITNNGMIIGAGQGTSRFRFTNSTTGCISEYSTSLTVNGVGTVFVDGEETICIGATTNLSPSSGGSWNSLNPDIASVTPNGVVTGMMTGTAYFVFTDAITGCSSDGSLDVIVQNGVPANIEGDSEVCIGYSLNLSPSSGGIWKSNNKDIATITNSGVVTGQAPGKVTFTFTATSAECVSITTSDSITVKSCKNHDFNVGVVNEEFFGNLSTNDSFPLIATYNSVPQLISKPNASIANFNINADGSYSFVGNKAGNYRYNIPICMDPIYSGCPTTMIEITLVENQYSTGNPVTNLDIATMFGNENASKGASSDSTFCINTIQNDVCIYTLGCDMDWSSAWIDANASNGVAEIKPNGIIEYTPNTAFIGFDTIYYGMCADGYTNCNTTMQVVTVNHSSAVNSVVASDDFKFTLRGSSVSGNILENDSDAEGDSITVIPQGSLMSPIVTAAGEYYIDALGNYDFTPNEAFSGHTEIIYEICDDNVDQACMKATLHLLVFDDISVKLRVYLQGALMQNGGATSATGRPLMRDDLRVSPYTGENYIPLMDPYTISADPWAETETKFNKIGPGLLLENQEISDSIGVFGISGDDAIVDWVHVELRSKVDMTVPIATRSGLLQRDGDVVDLDGVSDLRFNAVNVDSFYVVVKHRSHLAVMSEKVEYSEMVDFTSPSYPVYNFGVQGLNDFSGLSQNNNVISGFSALWAGDFDSNGKIKFTNPADDQNVLFVNVLFSSPDFLINYDQAYGYLTGDFNMNSKTKYTNPSDDINYLFSQILLYPLNSSFLSNYNSLIEQVPEEE